jgi:hypothetical protein
VWRAGVSRFDPELKREDIALLELVLQERRIAVQVGLKQVNAPAIEYHRRCVRRRDADRYQDF